jgi:putative membrane-bound dehydrogenase-like protein
MRAINCIFALVGFLAVSLHAADKPLRALLITGGCCHDYAKQKDILKQGLERRINIVIDQAHTNDKSTKPPLPIFGNPDYAKGYNVIIHDECAAGISDHEIIDDVLAPHRKGIPGVNLHCAMHSYRSGDFRKPVKIGADNAKWFEYIGLQSTGHGPQQPIEIQFENNVPFITKDVENWTTQREELYNNIQVLPNAKIVAHGVQGKRKAVVAWTNDYNGTRVFSTSIGHNNVTVADPRYLNLVARGLLWAVKREDIKVAKPKNETFDLNSKPKPKSATGKKNAKNNVPLNAASGKKVTASSEESNKGNLAKYAVDGDPTTRWCAANSSAGSWLQVDLGQAQDIENIRLIWEKANGAYMYRIEGSLDAKNWKLLVDQSQNKDVRQVTPHKVEANNTRYFKITYLGSKPAYWGSLWEFEAHTGSLPELPRKVIKASQKSTNASLKTNEPNVKAPDGFKLTIFAQPPLVNYPVCLTAASTGELFVGIDEQGSLGKEKGRGRVVRCLDTDGDGRADQINTFAKMDHPRGLIYDNGHLWVLHPPYLTLYKDTDHDGVADRQKRLVSGISTDYVGKRGADHTTNGIRMGIDGWIYIAVGDFGFYKAVGADGRTLSRRGGGIIRVRPDGTDMEIYSWGQRNILDACIDPYMNIFTRDNTNDGGGWDIRFSHIIQTAEYGYPSWYKNFSDEIMPTLADYGGGSGCGGMFYHDTRWPEPFSHGVYTCDWGRSAVFLHNPSPNGATFDAHQETFLAINRPTDIDVDGSGRMYVSSWQGGGFSYSHPNVGYVVQLLPKNYKPEPFPSVNQLNEKELYALLTGPSQVQNLHAQLEILRRGRSAQRTESLVNIASNTEIPLAGRVAAIFTLKQLDGAKATANLMKLSEQADITEFALRALTDRTSELEGIEQTPFVRALKSDNLRTRAQALVSLGRLGDASAAKDILPYAIAPRLNKQPNQNEPNPSAVIPHLATRTLVALKPVDTLLAALDTDHRATALNVLKYIHDDKIVDILISQAKDKLDLVTITTLVRLYHRESEYNQGWWGTRPDTSGPYFDRVKWSGSDRIESGLKTALSQAPKETVDLVKAVLARHKVKISGLPTGQSTAKADTYNGPIRIPAATGDPKTWIVSLGEKNATDRAIKAKGVAKRGEKLFTSQACIVCHTTRKGQTPKGPHLADISKRYKIRELIQSILNPNAVVAQGFDTYSFTLKDNSVHLGFVTLESADTISIRNAAGIATNLQTKQIKKREKILASSMPPGLVAGLTPEQLADLLAYLDSI